MAPGQISFMGKPDSLQGKITKGNVFLERGPICDKGWSYEDATVACRFTIIWCGSISSTSSHLMLGYDHGFPELGSTYGFATAEDKFEYTEVSCKGNEMSLLDCPFK